MCIPTNWCPKYSLMLPLVLRRKLLDKDTSFLADIFMRRLNRYCYGELSIFSRFSHEYEDNRDRRKRASCVINIF